MLALRYWKPIRNAIRRHMLMITPGSCSRDPEPVLAWHRLHDIDPSCCMKTRIFPSIGLALFKIQDLRAGYPFLVTDWLTGEQDVSFSWWVRRIRMPPAVEWCEYDA